MKDKKEFPVIEVPSSGKSNWAGGAWCLVWVYSTGGNFLLKGFYKECGDYIEEKGWKCWAVFNLYHKNWLGNSQSRTIIRNYKCNFEVYSPYKYGAVKNKDLRFKVYPKDETKEILYLKRLPGQFVEFTFEEKKEEPKRIKEGPIGRRKKK